MSNAITLSQVEIQILQRLYRERTAIQQQASQQIQEIDASIADILDKVRRLAFLPEGPMSVEKRGDRLVLVVSPAEPVTPDAPAESPHDSQG